MSTIYTLLGVPYVAVLDPVRGVVLQKAARKRIPSPGQMSLFGSNEPKEGDTKVENGVTYRLNQHSRWERTDKAKRANKAKPKSVVPVVPVVEEKAESKAKAKSKPSGIADMRQKGDTGYRRDEKPAMQTRKPSAKQQAEQQLEDLKAKNQAIRASAGPEFWLKDENFPKAIFSDFGITEEEMSTPEGIDKAYKRLARKVHPDLGGSEDQMANLTDLRKQMKVMARLGAAKPLKPRPSTLAQIGQRIADLQEENRQLQEMVGRAKKPQSTPVAAAPNFEVVSDRASQPPGTIFYDDPTATPEQRAWMEYGGQNYIPATIASRTEIDNTFPDVAQAAAKAREYGYQGADDHEVLARYMAGGAARNVGSQNVYPVYFEDEPTPVAAEVVVDEPKPKQRLGDRMRAIAQELRQETEAQKQYTARMLGAAAQLAQNQDNLIDEVVDMVNEDLDAPEALPEPTIGNMLAEQKAEGMTDEDKWLDSPPPHDPEFRKIYGPIKRSDISYMGQNPKTGLHHIVISGETYTYEAIPGSGKNFRRLDGDNKIIARNYKTFRNKLGIPGESGVADALGKAIHRI